MTCSQIIIAFFCFYVTRSNCRISDEKCDEYARYVNTEESSPLLLKHFRTNTVSQCGIVSVPLIVGGVKAQPKEFPHMASIGFGFQPNDILDWLCGGSLISNFYILTAAHCLESLEKGPAQRVKLGVINLNEVNDDELQEMMIVEKIPHPAYKRPIKENDIALIRMASPVTFSPYIRPACLNTKLHVDEHLATAIGFGSLKYGDSKGSTILMKVQLDVLPHDVCSNTFAIEQKIQLLPHGVTNALLCAGVLSGGKDTCQGDSGGPLQIVLLKPYCMYSIIGITSFGKFCGFENSPAIYTRVAYFVPWIEQIVWKDVDGE